MEKVLLRNSSANSQSTQVVADGTFLILSCWMNYETDVIYFRKIVKILTQENPILEALKSKCFNTQIPLLTERNRKTHVFNIQHHVRHHVNFSWSKIWHCPRLTIAKIMIGKILWRNENHQPVQTCVKAKDVGYLLMLL